MLIISRKRREIVGLCDEIKTEKGGQVLLSISIGDPLNAGFCEGEHSLPCTALQYVKVCPPSVLFTGRSWCRKGGCS